MGVVALPKIPPLFNFAPRNCKKELILEFQIYLLAFVFNWRLNLKIMAIFVDVSYINLFLCPDVDTLFLTTATFQAEMTSLHLFYNNYE